MTHYVIKMVAGNPRIVRGVAAHDRAHADFAPSSAQRVFDCPASYLATKNEPDSTSIDAETGTLAHFISDVCFREGYDPGQFYGQVVSVSINGTAREIEVDDEMVNGVAEYLNWCRDLPGIHLPEQRVDISRWTPLPGQFGTTDHGALGPDGFTLTDLKYGMEQVYASQNMQLVKYGLGMYDEYSWVYGYGPKTRVTLRICQPRISNFDVWETTVGELIQIGSELKKRYIQALKPDAPFGPSPKACRWCKIRGRCRAQAEFLDKQRALAYDDGFEELHLLSTEEIVAAWLHRPMAVARYDAIKEYLEARMMAGDSIPGLKLVEGRAFRSWESQQAAIFKMAELGIDDPQQWVSKLISPAQAEALLPRNARESLSDVIRKPRGKPTMVAESDPRPEYDRHKTDAYDDFVDEL